MPEGINSIKLAVNDLNSWYVQAIYDEFRLYSLGDETGRQLSAKWMELI